MSAARPCSPGARTGSSGRVGDERLVRHERRSERHRVLLARSRRPGKPCGLSFRKQTSTPHSWKGPTLGPCPVDRARGDLPARQPYEPGLPERRAYAHLAVPGELRGEPRRRPGQLVAPGSRREHRRPDLAGRPGGRARRGEQDGRGRARAGPRRRAWPPPGPGSPPQMSMLKSSSGCGSATRLGRQYRAASRVSASYAGSARPSAAAARPSWTRPKAISSPRRATRTQPPATPDGAASAAPDRPQRGVRVVPEAIKVGRVPVRRGCRPGPARATRRAPRRRPRPRQPVGRSRRPVAPGSSTPSTSAAAAGRGAGHGPPRRPPWRSARPARRYRPVSSPASTRDEPGRRRARREVQVERRRPR